jgi:hypothetical protein
MRRLMNLSPLQKVTKKYLRATITMREYEIAGKGYGEKWRVIIEEDVPTCEPPSQVGDATVIQQKNVGFSGPADITEEIALGGGPEYADDYEHDGDPRARVDSLSPYP